MVWWYAIVEARHELQNPTSAEKIRLVGERLGLGPGSRVLDVGAGRGGPAIVLAQEFGCRVTCIERSPEFVAAACERIRTAGLGSLVEVIEGDAAAYSGDGFDAALCLGATFAYGGLTETIERLTASAPVLAVGEPFWRVWPIPAGVQPAEDEDWLPLAETVERVEEAGVRVVSVVTASDDDWDRYESLHWLALDDWLAANPGHPQAAEFRALGAEHRARYLAWRRELLGWAIFVCRG